MAVNSGLDDSPLTDSPEELERGVSFDWGKSDLLDPVEPVVEGVLEGNAVLGDCGMDAVVYKSRASRDDETAISWTSLM